MGLLVGWFVGLLVGCRLGFFVGDAVVGFLDVLAFVGWLVDDWVGSTMGLNVGKTFLAVEGMFDGGKVGNMDGESSAGGLGVSRVLPTCGNFVSFSRMSEFLVL